MQFIMIIHIILELIFHAILEPEDFTLETDVDLKNKQVISNLRGRTE